MTVVDASTLVKFLLKEPGYREVKQYLAGNTVYSVDQVIKEVSNAIWKHTAVFKKFRTEDARKCYTALIKLIEGKVIVIEPQDKYMDQAFEIALNHEITVYDALYIAQAQTRNTRLLTSDKRQALIAEKLGIETIYL